MHVVISDYPGVPSWRQLQPLLPLADTWLLPLRMSTYFSYRHSRVNNKSWNARSGKTWLYTYSLQRLRLRSFGMTWIRIGVPRSLESSQWMHYGQGIYWSLWCTMIRSWITDVDSDHPKRVHPKVAFHCDDPNQCSTITQIMVHQRSWGSHSGQGFSGPFDAPRSVWSWLVDSDYTKETHADFVLGCKVLSVEISYIHSFSTDELKNTARWNYSFAQPAFISIQLPR